jgi:hypothetical protein
MRIACKGVFTAVSVLNEVTLYDAEVGLATDEKIQIFRRTGAGVGGGDCTGNFLGPELRNGDTNRVIKGTALCRADIDFLRQGIRGFLILRIVRVVGGVCGLVTAGGEARARISARSFFFMISLL